jgi:hypothetical protein
LLASCFLVDQNNTHHHVALCLQIRALPIITLMVGIVLICKQAQG